jgi:hypothetical protein
LRSAAGWSPVGGTYRAVWQFFPTFQTYLPRLRTINHVNSAILFDLVWFGQ